MALDSCYDCCVFPPLDLGWELRTLGVGVGAGDGAQEDGIHGGFFPAMLGVDSPVSSEASSGGGYLEDAVAHSSDRCKRQRMTVAVTAAAAAATPPPPRRPATANEDLQCLLQSFWDSSSGEGDLLHDLNIIIPETSSFASEEEDASVKEQEQEQGDGGPSAAAAAQGGGEAEAAGPPPVSASRSTGTQTQTQPAPAGTLRLRLQKATTGAAARRRSGSSFCLSSGSGDAASASSSCSSLAGKENRSVGVLYRFAVVKPMGLDGGGTTTLNDVNQRILKRPARPVRHPVGPFACSPAVSTHGLGLSGKAVVSLTRIRTGGKGTITIIRTRG